MDFVEESTTRQADTILANSGFTVGVFKRHMPSIPITPRVVYPGINFDAYAAPDASQTDPDIAQVSSDRPTLLSVNRFEQKKNGVLAIESFALLRKGELISSPGSLRLVLAGGYDPRLQDNIKTLETMLESAKKHSLSYTILTPSTSTVPLPSYPSIAASAQVADVVLLLNFSGPQRSALLNAPSTQVLLYTPANEHFGIGPVEGMICGLPVLAANSGGPTESVVDAPPAEKTGWLRSPEPELWAEALREIIALNDGERHALSERARGRAREKFGMEAMARDMEAALKETVAMGQVPTPVAFWVVVALLFSLLAYVTQLVSL
ncbi:hypothetical protein GSI_11243 [Ganoderma sinense ZZ0214-1]|uniref:Alpha-1,3/1,6-mannosyltransferase ALG2 n=1 Tax=Ganoderma sinense ZZ0214-1 TaxID=1077348 RepID=A0A2G8RYV2_9APHY|nr:hypothetical protein GSI_11243 [Ganoderma sinense ZZ0214-1]